MSTMRDKDTPDDTSARAPGDMVLIGRLTYGSLGLALIGLALLSGGLGEGWLVRAIGGTLAMLSIVGMLTSALATVRPSVLHGLRVERTPHRR